MYTFRQSTAGPLPYIDEWRQVPRKDNNTPAPSNRAGTSRDTGSPVNHLGTGRSGNGGNKSQRTPRGSARSNAPKKSPLLTGFPHTVTMSPASANGTPRDDLPQDSTPVTRPGLGISSGGKLGTLPSARASEGEKDGHANKRVDSKHRAREDDVANKSQGTSKDEHWSDADKGDSLSPQIQGRASSGGGLESSRRLSMITFSARKLDYLHP